MSTTEQLGETEKARMEELQKKRKDTGGHLTDSERLELTGLTQKEAEASGKNKADKESPAKGQQKIK